jgi:hypothetical protein
MDGDTAIGRTTVGGFAVELRGAIATTMMWQLIDRLAARNLPSN